MNGLVISKVWELDKQFLVATTQPVTKLTELQRGQEKKVEEEAEQPRASLVLKAKVSALHASNRLHYKLTSATSKQE